jgi:hypothetical protein
MKDDFFLGTGWQKHGLGEISGLNTGENTQVTQARGFAVPASICILFPRVQDE